MRIMHFEYLHFGVDHQQQLKWKIFVFRFFETGEKFPGNNREKKNKIILANVCNWIQFKDFFEVLLHLVKSLWAFVCGFVVWQ